MNFDVVTLTYFFVYTLFKIKIEIVLELFPRKLLTFLYKGAWPSACTFQVFATSSVFSPNLLQLSYQNLCTTNLIQVFFVSSLLQFWRHNSHKGELLFCCHTWRTSVLKPKYSVSIKTIVHTSVGEHLIFFARPAVHFEFRLHATYLLPWAFFPNFHQKSNNVKHKFKFGFHRKKMANKKIHSQKMYSLVSIVSLFWFTQCA